jgi:hypothetical protein
MTFLTLMEKHTTNAGERRTDVVQNAFRRDRWLVYDAVFDGGYKK